jgi:DNA repair protein RadC
MDSTLDTTQSPETMPPETTTRYVREVIVNYRGRKKEAAKVSSATVASEWVRKIIPDNSREHLATLYLDGAHKIVGYAVVATGTANSCVVHPREIFQRAILLGAVALIMGHNHPSEGLSPSTEDERVTRLISEAGTLLGIRVLDHVIVNSDSHYSFAEMGRL